MIDQDLRKIKYDWHFDSFLLIIHESFGHRPWLPILINHIQYAGVVSYPIKVIQWFNFTIAAFEYVVRLSSYLD